MKTLLSCVLAGALFVFTSSSAFAVETSPSQSAIAPTYHVKGVIKRIAPDALTLAHDAVPELQWPPMTMPFALANDLKLPPLTVDDAVDFDVRLIDGRYEITALTVRH
ncbi:hypothetical protein GJV06_03745 [Enterobacteriaceae bacterium RIT691]|nr:hypothetical protein [Enterobacteriaceae bacterium RIT691]